MVTWTFTKKNKTWFVLTFTDFYKKKHGLCWRSLYCVFWQYIFMMYNGGQWLTHWRLLKTITYDSIWQRAWDSHQQTGTVGTKFHPFLEYCKNKPVRNTILLNTLRMHQNREKEHILMKHSWDLLQTIATLHR